MDELHTYIKSLTDNLSIHSINITGRKPIAYGMQLIVCDGNSTIPLNVYSGKKGISVTVGGSSNSELKAKINQLLKPDYLSVENIGKQPAKADFQHIEGFDGRWIGTDESGKGDFFGPLVIAAVYVSNETAEVLENSGIKDSKALSDEKNQALAARIREICANSYTELELMPNRYNQLYQQFKNEGKNLNHLLAWGHARVIENLLEIKPCKYVLSDQFANEKVLTSRLMDKGRTITLLQAHKAERNIAVAAASILARDRYLTRLAQLTDKFTVNLPKGASSQVVAAARSFIDIHGKSSLAEVAKLHFKTIDYI